MRRRHLRRAAATLGLTLAGVAGLVSVAACADEATTTTGGPGGSGAPDHGTRVEGDGWEGARLDARLDHLQLDDGTIVEDASSFVPTESDVRRFEAQVETALPGAGNPSDDQAVPDDLDGYVRQYTGVAGAGARHLVVAGICERAAADMDWADGWIEVSDGGTCFWDARMDLDSGEILRLSFHGSA